MTIASTMFGAAAKSASNNSEIVEAVGEQLANTSNLTISQFMVIGPIGFLILACCIVAALCGLCVAGAKNDNSCC